MFRPPLPVRTVMCQSLPSKANSPQVVSAFSLSAPISHVMISWMVSVNRLRSSLREGRLKTRYDSASFLISLRLLTVLPQNLGNIVGPPFLTALNFVFGAKNVAAQGVNNYAAIGECLPECRLCRKPVLIGRDQAPSTVLAEA